MERGEIILPVDTATITLVDLNGRPVAGATVVVNNMVIGKTDNNGVIRLEQVPLDNIYDIVVFYGEEKIAEAKVVFTPARTEAVITVGIHDLRVFVRSATGHPLSGALVELTRDGVVLASDV